MKPRVRKRHYRRGEEEEKEEKASIEREKEERTQSRVGPPSPHIIVQLMKDGIPHCSLDVRPQIFIEAFVRATVMTPDLEFGSHGLE